MRADFSLDYDVLTVEQPQKVYLMIRLTAGSAPDDQIRRPLNLSVVIDRSGSMAGDKIDYTRQAAQFLVQNLGIRDMLSIVLYSNKIETLLPPQYVQRKDMINQLIEKIRVGGTTNLSGGWLEGCKHVSDNLSENSLNRVILMTDGLANRGIVDQDKLVQIARQKYAEGVSTTTMGLGEDFNEDLLIELANAGGGAFYFIESPDVTPIIFEEELQGLLNVVGQNLQVHVQPTQFIKGIRQLNAYPMHISGTQYSFRLGDVFGDEIKTLLVEFSIPALHDLGEMQIANLVFEYDELIADGIKHHKWEMPVNIHVKQDTNDSIPNQEVQQAVLLLKAAQARSQAVKSADLGQYKAASEILKEVANNIDNAEVSNEQLDEERNSLLQQAAQLEQGEQLYTDYNRKTMSTQAIYTMTSRHNETVHLRRRERKRFTQKKKVVTVNDEPIERKYGVPPTHVTWQDHTYKLDSDLVRFGRSIHNEIVIDAEGVSRFHCQVKRDGDELVLEDVGSTNGTIVDGIRLTKTYPLSIGDVVYLCDEKLIFHAQSKD